MFMTASEMRRCYKDTEKLCKENERLQKAIESSVAGTRFYDEEETPKVPTPRYETTALSSKIPDGSDCRSQFRFRKG